MYKFLGAGARQIVIISIDKIIDIIKLKYSRLLFFLYIFNLSRLYYLTYLNLLIKTFLIYNLNLSLLLSNLLILIR